MLFCVFRALAFFAVYELEGFLRRFGAVFITAVIRTAWKKVYL